MNENKYFLVVNAANKDKDYKWMCGHKFGDVEFIDVSSQYAQVAVQGPKAKEIVAKIAKEGSIPDKYYHAKMGAEIAEIPCICSTTGYTGEDGVEIYYPRERPKKCGMPFWMQARMKDSFLAVLAPETL